MAHKQGEYKYSCVYDFLLEHSGCKIKHIMSGPEDGEIGEIGFECKTHFEVYMYDKVKGKHGL